MKIFLDTANIDDIRQAARLGIIDGVTTNPSLIAKEKRDLKATIKEICTIVDGPISAEVMALQADEMVKEGLELAKIHENVTVKIPFTTEGIIATNKLSKEGVNVNVTLIFSPNQAIIACKAGARFISPFVGRLDDIGHDGIAVASQCQDVVSMYDYDTEIIAASIRHTMHVFQCMEQGIDIATIPYKVLMGMFKHPLTDIGIAQFIKDWENANK